MIIRNADGNRITFRALPTLLTSTLVCLVRLPVPAAWLTTLTFDMTYFCCGQHLRVLDHYTEFRDKDANFASAVDVAYMQEGNVIEAALVRSTLVWDASANDPNFRVVTPCSRCCGHFGFVAVDGTTTIDGVSNWTG